MNLTATDPTVIAERRSRDGRVTWQARISPDRGRLEVVAVVEANDQSTIVEILSDTELKELLTPKPRRPGAARNAARRTRRATAGADDARTICVEDSEMPSRPLRPARRARGPGGRDP